MPTVMNTEAFWSRVEEDGPLARDLINLFFMETPRILSDLRAAVLAHDGDGLKRAAHAMRGMVANFSAPPAVDAAGVLEEMGRSGDLAKAEEAFNILDHQLVYLRSALAHFEEGIIA
jgi:two-component system sensor histidine kinase/response regulator